ncbi:MAG: proline dehydrogenase family protein [Planctomycetota bacterium]
MQIFNRAVVSVLPWVPKPMVWRVSRRYIAGEALADALGLVAALNAKGMSATIDVLGEDVTDDRQALGARDSYLEALHGIHDQKLNCNISVKLSQMGLRFNPKLCADIARALAQAAAERRNFFRIDMEDSSVTTQTLDIYRQLRGDFANTGTVIQAYMRRSAADVRALLAEKPPTNLRLCKGIYRESAEIAYQDREEIRASYRELLELMLTGGIARVGIATHDDVLVDAALEQLTRLKISKDRYEFQMLLGVAESLRTRLVAAGHPLRVYIPYGKDWFAYSVRRLRENPQIAAHVMRNFFGRGA